MFVMERNLYASHCGISNENERKIYHACKTGSVVCRYKFSDCVAIFHQFRQTVDS